MMRNSSCRSWNARSLGLAATLLVAAGALLAAFGCAEKKPPPASAGPAFEGPAYLRGTVGSMAKLRGYEPVLVSGYGLVVDLRGTGSSEVPEFLRRKLINDMARLGMGDSALGADEYTPARTLASKNTAIVAVYGLIPPGATKGTRFDVWIEALPQTQTVSLEYGRLFTTELSIDGTNPSVGFSKPLATAFGPVYISPIQEPGVGKDGDVLLRSATILSGGTATEDAKLQLTLNQPNWSRSQMIADRINERFRRGVGDRNETASAKDDVYVDLHIPSRFARDPAYLLSLVQHLYVTRGLKFEPEQARRLGAVLEGDLAQADAVALAWESLGRTALPVIREFYTHHNIRIRLAALTAGVRLDDARALTPINDIAQLPDPVMRWEAARLLVYMPDHLDASRQLRALLNDTDERVRLAAYETLIRTGDPLFIQHMPLGGKGKDFKFYLDIVDVQRPLMYVTQKQLPRIAVFNPYCGFNLPMVASLWDSALLIKAMDPEGVMEVYYRQPGGEQGKVYRIAPTVANLVYLMGHKPTLENPTEGLNLPYHAVVDALNQLQKMGKISGSIRYEESQLAVQIADARKKSTAPRRPETSGLPPVVTGEEGDVIPTTATPAVPPDASADLPATPPGSIWQSPDGSSTRPESSTTTRPGVGAMPTP